MRIQKYRIPLVGLLPDSWSIGSIGGTLCVLVLCSSIVGCASRPSSVTTSHRGYAAVPEFYVVQRGDTVSKIALRYGLNYPDIGRLNQLDTQYTIHPNQRLRLRGAGQVSSRSVSTRQQPTPTRAATTAVRVPVPIVPQPLPASRPPNVALAQGLVWQWPSNNLILEEFNESAQIKGLRFEGSIGDPVLAAAAGEVVYSNNGLTEYGNLILLRHGSGYITAYAHNQRLLVQEGQMVRLGQPIAEMGNSGTNRVMLEFQVRKEGKPINPKQVLPAR